MTIAPHHGNAEWHRHAGLAPLERALATLSLPSLNELDGLDDPKTGPPAVYQWLNTPVPPVDLHLAHPTRAATGSLPTTGATPTAPGQDPRSAVHERGDLRGWTLYLSNVPVAISTADTRWPHAQHRLLHDLAGAFAFGWRQIDQPWRLAHRDTTGTSHEGQPTSHPDDDHFSRSVQGPAAGYVLDLVVTDADSDTDVYVHPALQVSALTTTDTPQGRLVRAVIDVNIGVLAAAADADVSATRTAMASVITTLAAATLPPATVQQITAAWLDAPPTMAMRTLSPPTVRNNLPAPVQLQPALTAQVNRLIAEEVHRAGIAPGTYTGQEARDLDRDVLAPTALRLFTERLQAFAVDDIVLTGMQEMERALAERGAELRNLEQASQYLQLEWDPVQRRAQLQREHLTQRRCIEVIVEASLRTQPAGDQALDRVAWAEVLAAADAYLAATTRSEHLHHQVRPTVLTISDSYELDITSAPAPAITPTDAGPAGAIDTAAPVYHSTSRPTNKLELLKNCSST